MTGDPAPLPPAGEVVTRFRRWLEAQAPPDDRRSSEGPSRPDEPVPDGVMQLLLELLRSNLEQWELEDVTRLPGSDDATVARAKRSIDRLNLERHRLAERVDAAIDATLVQSSAATPSTESPAMAFDRLSVLAIRLDRTSRAALTAGGGGEDFDRQDTPAEGPAGRAGGGYRRPAGGRAGRATALRPLRAPQALCAGGLTSAACRRYPPRLNP